jgi:hypothetical protein
MLPWSCEADASGQLFGSLEELLSLPPEHIPPRDLD